MSAAVDRHLQDVAAALDATGAATARTLDDVWDASPAAARALGAFLEDYRCRPLAGHDLLEATLGERPDLVVAALEARRSRPPSAAPDGGLETVRDRVPAEHRSRFDALLADACASYALRDDDVGVCWNWPLGLIRLAGLEAGRRLARDGVVERPTDLFEAAPDELPGLLAGRAPSADELAARRDLRERAGGTEPPGHLAGGDDPAEHPPLPDPVAELSAIRDRVWAVAPPRVDEALHGIGIGTGAAVGPARLIRGVDDVGRVEAGDVLVALATTTAFNAVLPLVAGVVTQLGGLLSHAAILARELGLPAVVGVGDVFDHVAEGDLVEVDAAAGVVRVVDRPGPP